ncbi:MAG: flagellar export protein FliJ [Syntrophobacterales bacterium]|jgi:flagellar export protein FliJ|nr:flagellar export protein FliJ [Syntrophobacterales bacterium]
MFTYKLKSVLEYRKNIEEQKLVEFSAQERNLRRAEEVLQNIGEERQGLSQTLKGMQNQKCNGHDVALMLAYADELQNREKKQHFVVQKERFLLEEKRKNLLEAVTRRKILEAHQQKQFEAYQGDQLLAERRQSDETAVQRFVKREP